MTEKNVLILKYYSFENYFLDPKVMARIGVLDSEDQFYEIFLEKWHEYLYRLRSGEKLRAVVGHDFCEAARSCGRLSDMISKRRMM